MSRLLSIFRNFIRLLFKRIEKTLLHTPKPYTKHKKLTIDWRLKVNYTSFKEQEKDNEKANKEH